MASVSTHRAKNKLCKLARQLNANRVPCKTLIAHDGCPRVETLFHHQIKYYHSTNNYRLYRSGRKLMVSSSANPFEAATEVLEYIRTNASFSRILPKNFLEESQF